MSPFVCAEGERKEERVYNCIEKIYKMYKEKRENMRELIREGTNM